MKEYFEDLRPGTEFVTQAVTITEDAIIRFGLEWDFQPFHVDKIAAASSIFGQLVGSGLQTMLITFRLCVQADIFTGTIAAGLGFHEVRFPNPVYPGNTLRASVTVRECRLSRSKKGYGVVTWDIETFDETKRLVCAMKLANLVQCGPGAPQ